MKRSYFVTIPFIVVALGGILVLVWGCHPPSVQLSPGERLYRASCASCHRLIQPQEHDEDTWRAYVEKYGDRLPLMHVKDGPISVDQPMTAVGSGRMDIRACVEAAGSGSLRWLIIEADEVDGDMVAAMRESANYMLSEHLAEGSSGAS